MPKRVGVRLPDVVREEGKQKRDLLLFDQIAVPQIQLFIQTIEVTSQMTGNESEMRLGAKLRWLLDQGLLSDPEVDLTAAQVSQPTEVKKPSVHQENAKLDALAEGKIEAFLAMDDPARPDESELRLIARGLRNKGIHAVALLDTEIGSSIDRAVATVDVIQIMLNELPMPNSMVGWEWIMEYRDDPDAMNAFPQLRNWMNAAAAAKMPFHELEENLESLLRGYEQHMQIHKTKGTSGMLETVVVSTAEIAEDLVKFRWSMPAKRLFTVKHRKIGLLANEAKATGHEIAHIIRTSEACH